MSTSFDYAIVRVVPRVERQEFLNAGVIVLSLQHKFLRAQVSGSYDRFRILWPSLDLDEIAAQLEAIPRIAAADVTAGPIAHLSIRERFHWLVAPRSTAIQVSPVHTGLTEDPEETLNSLYRTLVGHD